MKCLCLGEKEGHSHVCTCCLHLLDKGIGSGTSGANVVYQQHTLAVEIVGVYLHVALLSVLLADMHFLTLADNLDMLKAVDCIAHGAHVCGKSLVSALIGLLTTGRDADYDGVCQVHCGKGLANYLRCPLGCIPPTCFEVEQVAHSVLRLEVCFPHIALRGVLHNGVFEHI